jgi:hypothetical protein
MKTKQTLQRTDKHHWHNLIRNQNSSLNSGKYLWVQV